MIEVCLIMTKEMIMTWLEGERKMLKGQLIEG